MASVISIEELSKSYRLGAIGGGTLRDDLARWWARVRNARDPLLQVGQEQRARRVGQEFWALRDISLEVNQGEVLGIIGRNGAGKSTLLKILSRVTGPTGGFVKIRGRIASLLEVGTGFHPELTGRENVFLNGAILGMTKSEIRRKFDEIVAFSEVEEFIDTPVKRYSSGMYVRLAFAVAAHLEPEILIVDEVLAVGDAQFQKRCIGKMKDVSSKDGKTVLFVSHNMEAIRSLCTSAILLRDGLCEMAGAAPDTICAYLREESTDEPTVQFQRKHNSALEFETLQILDAANQPQAEIDACQPFTIALTYEVTAPLDNVEIAIRIYNSANIAATTLISTEGLAGRDKLNLAPGRYRAAISVPAHFLMPDRYALSPAAFQFGSAVFDQRDHAIHFRVMETGTGVAKYGHHSTIGVVLNNFPWSNSPLP